MKIEKQRAMVMFFALALAMVGFLGLAIGDPEPPLTAPNVTIEDTFAPADDKNAYVGDTFMFMVEGYSAPHNNSNITVEITIGPLSTDTMTWNATKARRASDLASDSGAAGRNSVQVRLRRGYAILYPPPVRSRDA